MKTMPQRKKSSRKATVRAWKEASGMPSKACMRPVSPPLYLRRWAMGLGPGCRECIARVSVGVRGLQRFVPGVTVSSDSRVTLWSHMASPASGESTARVFSIQAQPDGWLLQRLLTLAQPGLESLLGLARLNEMYAAHPDRDGRRFCDVALEALQIVPHASPDPIEHVPARGGLIVIANHPFGGVDGLALHAVLARVRDDVKLLGNFLLAQIPDL